VGPWFSYDRVQWHRDQLLGLRSAGVDVILPVYSGSAADRASYAIKGLDCLVQAVKEAAQDRVIGGEQHSPAIGMQLDTAAMRRQYGAPPDLKSEEVQRAFYGMLREFFLHVPPELRAVVPRPADPARRGVIVLLNDASGFKDLDGTFAATASRRFEQEFGVGIVWLASADFQSRAPGLDGYVPPASDAKQPPARLPGIRVARVRPGYDNTAVAGSTKKVESRLNGRTYIQSWLEVLRSGADWVWIDSWNGFGDGTAVAPSLEFGVQFMDLTRAGSAQHRASRDVAAHIRWAALPEQMAPQTLYHVEALVANVGKQGWGSPARAGLSYRWFRDGKPVGDPGPVIMAGPVGPGATRRMTLGVTSPVANGSPLPAGDYELRLDMVRTTSDEGQRSQGAEGGGATTTTKKPSERSGRRARPATEPSRLAWFEDEGGASYRGSVRIGAPDAVRPSWLSSTLPSLMKSGSTYTVAVRVRNDGAAPLRYDEGAGIGYRWRRVGVDPRGGAARDEAVAPEGTRTPFPVDVPPGVAITVPVTVRVMGEGDRPLPVGDPKQGWAYQLEWDLFTGKEWASAAGGRTRREVAQVLPEDIGPRFLGSGLPNEMKAGSTVTAKFGLRNTGPEAWSPQRDRIAYHWFHFDGTEAVWSGEGPRLPAEVPPGETVVVPDLAVRVPDTPGPMYLVLDLKRGDVHASSTESTRSGDILVHPVLVTEGSMTPVDLTKSFDIDGISLDDNPSNGDLDGEGRTLPAESLPSYVWRPASSADAIVTDLYPSGLWARTLAKGATRVPFRFPPKRDGVKNAVRSAGQRIAVPEGRRRAVHFLATATAPHDPGAVTFVYADSSTSTQPLRMSLWTEGPRHDEAVAFTASHRHQKEGDDLAAPVYLYQYTLKPDAGKSLAAIVMPQSPAMKFFALTLEGN
jgi:hypothetical protein